MSQLMNCQQFTGHTRKPFARDIMLAKADKYATIMVAPVTNSSTTNVAYATRQILTTSSKKQMLKKLPLKSLIMLPCLSNIGTTTKRVCRARIIEHQGLQVITNNLNVAAIFKRNKEETLPSSLLVATVPLSWMGGVMGEATIEPSSSFRVGLWHYRYNGIDPNDGLFWITTTRSWCCTKYYQ